MDKICATIAKESRSKWVYYSWRWLGCAARIISKPSEQEGGTRWQSLKNCPEYRIHILVNWSEDRSSHRLKWHIGYQKLLSVRFWNYLNFTNKKGEKLELEQTKHKYKYRVQGENYRNGSKNE